MKKHYIKLLLLVPIIIILANCKKYGKTFDTYFYTDIENSAAPLYLYIDGKSKGELPNLKTSTSATNDTVINNALHLSLHSGKYKVEGRDNQGNVKYSGYLKFRSNSIGNGGTMGGQESAASGNIIVSKIYF